MVISSYHIQTVLRTYSQQLSQGTRLSRHRRTEHTDTKDQVKISFEARRKYLIDKISQEIISQLTNKAERNETAQEVLDRLSQEYGKPLDIDLKEGQDMVFKVLNGNEGETVNYLSPIDTEKLKNRLFDITKSVVSDNIL